MREPIQLQGFSDLDPDYALIDKLEIKSTLGAITLPDGFPLRQFKANLSRHPTQGERAEYYRLIEENNAVETEATTPHSPTGAESNFQRDSGWIFKSYGSDRNRAKHFVATKAIEGRYPMPLFTGSLSIREGYQGSDSEEGVADEDLGDDQLYDYAVRRASVIKYELGLNLNRFLHHNRLGLRSPERYKVGVHKGDIEADPTAEEFSLDHNDNWVQADNLRYSQSWDSQRRYLDFYIQGVERAITMDLYAATPSNDVEEASRHFLFAEEHDQKYSLNYCEIAWEFASEHPIQQIEQLAPYMRQYARGVVEENDFMLDPADYRFSEMGDGFSKSLTMRLGNGNRIVAYAKTNKRVRFEYCCRLDRGHSPAPLAVKTADSRERLVGLVSQLKEFALIEMNRLFAHFRRCTEPVIVAESKSMADLYCAVLKHCDLDAELAGLLLEQLQNTGCIKPVPKVRKRLHTAIRNMAKKKPQVIEYDKSNSTSYFPTAPYRWAVSQLGSVNGWETLSALPQPECSQETESAPAE